MRVLVMVGCLGLVGCASWTWRDTAMQTVVVGALALDATQSIANLERGGAETNPLLGSRPSSAGTACYFVTAAAVHFGVALLLDGWWRTGWQGAAIALETKSVVHNAGVFGGLMP